MSNRDAFVRAFALLLAEKIGSGDITYSDCRVADLKVALASPAAQVIAQEAKYPLAAALGLPTTRLRLAKSIARIVSGSPQVRVDR